jgi:hypothetical protein
MIWIVLVCNFKRIYFWLLDYVFYWIINELVLIFFHKRIICDYYLTTIHQICFFYEISKLIIMMTLLNNFFISHFLNNWVRFSSLWIDFQRVNNNKSISRICDKLPSFILTITIPLLASKLRLTREQWTVMIIFQVVCLFYYKLT